MKTMNILIKPASSLCNMDCKYCFYKDEVQKRNVESYGIMSDQTMEHIVKKAMDYAETSCTFGFQGGEPTLAGLNYFRRFTSLVEAYNKKNITVRYCLQTNGIFYSGASKKRDEESYRKDREWLEFLKEKKFLVGVSLDGTKEVHDANRLDQRGKSTFLRVARAVEAMLNYGVEVNVLTVLTRQSARHIEKIYAYLKKIGIRYEQYIPCMDPLDERRGEQDYSLSPKLFAKAQKRLFDLWFADWMAKDYISIRQFENWVGILKGYEPEACAMYGRCTMQNVIESNGDVFPCDFYAIDKYKIGNITEESFKQIYEKIDHHLFFEDAQRRDERCQTCRWYPVCRGGCKRDCDRTNDQTTYNYYCEAYQEIFAYIIERLEYLASR